MKYGFGIIGAGGIAEVHARAIQSIEGMELIGVYDTHPERTVAFSRRFSCMAFNTPDELCSSSRIDIVSICTPSGAHLEPSLKAISEGKHCIIEKPLEITLERCDRIIEEGIKQKVAIAGIFPMRFADVNIELKKAVDAGRFGTFVLGDVYIKWYRTQQYYNEVKWRASLRYGGGGAIMNQGIHSIDLLQWCMGKVDSVSAFTSSPGHKDIEVEDTSVAALKFKNGALGVIEASTAVNPGFFRKIEILGTKGSAVVEEESIKTWKFDKEGKEDDIIRKRFSGEQLSGGGVSDPKAISDTGHIRQIRDFVEALDNRRPPAIDAIEARKAVELVLAIYESARLKKVIYL
jgi:predicted dehydrogenase